MSIMYSSMGLGVARALYERLAKQADVRWQYNHVCVCRLQCFTDRKSLSCFFLSAGGHAASYADRGARVWQKHHHGWLAEQESARGQHNDVCVPPGMVSEFQHRECAAGGGALCEEETGKDLRAREQEENGCRHS